MRRAKGAVFSPSPLFYDATDFAPRRRRPVCPADEDISANVTSTSPPSTHIGPVTRARARQLNYQVLSFLVNPSNVHEHMMLPKIDTFVLLMSEGPSMDKEDGHWSGIKHGKE